MKFLRLFKLALLLVPCAWPFLRSEQRIVILIVLLSLAGGVMFAGFEGTSSNIFQDTAVGLGIAAGLLVNVVRTRLLARRYRLWQFRPVAATALALTLAAPIFGIGWDTIRDIGRTGLIGQGRAAEEAFLADVDYLLERPGPSICESLLLCYYAGKPFIVDPFNSRQAILAGRLDETPMLVRIAAKDFAVIQLDHPACEETEWRYCQVKHGRPKVDRFTDAFLAAVDGAYRLDRRSATSFFYVPKD
jgi:hypothetical protein